MDISERKSTVADGRWFNQTSIPRRESQLESKESAGRGVNPRNK